MKLLLDTHTFLWFVLDDLRLSPRAKAAIADPANEILISPASYWEMAIKVSTGKLALTQPYLSFIEDQLATNRITILPIEPKHTSVLVGLPHHHRDPFDRLLVSQSLSEQIPLISGDAVFSAYGVQLVW